MHVSEWICTIRWHDPPSLVAYSAKVSRTEDRQKIPVPRHSFLWSLNETSGEILTHAGPTEFTPSANDRIVRANERGGFEQAAMEARPFVVARDSEYVILDHPVFDEISEGPNGQWVPGGNKEKQLRMGTTKIIPGPCAFPLWPGQSAEVRHAHKLGANHYLLVEVVGAVDPHAPYYRLVIESAQLSSTVIDPEDRSEQEGPSRLADTNPDRLRVGQRIVIQGRHTQFFIPPTGIQVVPAVEEEERNDEDGVKQLPSHLLDELQTMLQTVDSGLTSKQFSVLKNELRHRSDLIGAQKAVLLSAVDEQFQKRRESKTQRPGDRAERRAGRPTDPYARRAVVLGPKNFCILFDADGNPRIVRGPARVFPGPNDTFLQRGSRRRVYDAYELADNQALWLRVISDISKERLAEQLPPDETLSKAVYRAGDELLVRGRPTVFLPFIEAEVLNPRTREPHVGNDHAEVVIDAIGIDQKSGIYVREWSSGRVKMVRGETSYLVDPRSEEHVERRVSADDWNLWIGHAEPRKRAEADVVTPWALSVIVPTNEAIHITSRHGQRVVVGPRTELLEYEERLTALKLSEGANKDGTDTSTTCFLRIQGGRVADGFELESADFVRFRVRLQITYGFAGDPERWFNVEDPIKRLADVLRARLRNESRQRAASELLASFPALLHATLFGDRPTWVFEENGMEISSVDVLSVVIADPQLAKLFEEAQRESVSMQLQDSQATRRLASAAHQAKISEQQDLLQRDANRRLHENAELEVELENQVDKRKAELVGELEALQTNLALSQERNRIEHIGLLSRLQAESRAVVTLFDAEAESKAQALRQAEDVKTLEARAEVQRITAKALADADAVRLSAIQQELVAALHTAADSEVMKAAANNMNLVALLGGKSPSELFQDLLEGTPLSRTPAQMKRRAQAEGNADREES